MKVQWMLVELENKNNVIATIGDPFDFDKESLEEDLRRNYKDLSKESVYMNEETMNSLGLSILRNIDQYFIEGTETKEIPKGILGDNEREPNFFKGD